MNRGPKDPELYRTYDQWRRRWYVDTLPPDDIEPEPDPKRQLAAFSTIKKAWNKPFRTKLETGETVSLDAHRVATFAADHLDQLRGLPRDAAVAMMCGQPERALGEAGQRGSGVHEGLELAAISGKPVDLTLWPDAQAFEGACRAFMTDVKPIYMWAEVVAFNPVLGYAGTLDAGPFLRQLNACLVCGDETCTGLSIIDYKTRGKGHGAYVEEAAQLAAYAKASYYIISTPEGDKRVKPPDWRHGVIVSLTTEGYRLYPVDLDTAWLGFQDLLTCWTAQRDGQAECRDSIGHPLHVPVAEPSPAAAVASEPAASPSSAAGSLIPDNVVPLRRNTEQHPANGKLIPGTVMDRKGGLIDSVDITDPFKGFPQQPASMKRWTYMRTRTAWLIEQIGDGGIELTWRWPHGVPTFKESTEHSDAQLDAILAVLVKVEGEHQLPFYDEIDPKPPAQLPSNGRTDEPEGNHPRRSERKADHLVRADDERVLALGDRFNALPVEVGLDIQDRARAIDGWQDPGSGRCLTSHFEQLETWITEAEAEGRIHETFPGTTPGR